MGTTGEEKKKTDNLQDINTVEEKELKSVSGGVNMDGIADPSCINPLFDSGEGSASRILKGLSEWTGLF